MEYTIEQLSSIAIKRLCEEISKQEQENNKLKQENEELKNNWNKLKEYFEQEIENNKYCYLGTNPIDKCRLEISNDYLDKMKETEGEK